LRETREIQEKITSGLGVLQADFQHSQRNICRSTPFAHIIKELELERLLRFEWHLKSIKEWHKFQIEKHKEAKAHRVRLVPLRRIEMFDNGSAEFSLAQIPLDKALTLLLIARERERRERGRR
jgi:hypothetical protein